MFYLREPLKKFFASIFKITDHINFVINKADSYEQIYICLLFAMFTDYALTSNTVISYYQYEYGFASFAQYLIDFYTVEIYLIVIDEYPYLVKANPGITSILQDIIDNKINIWFKETPFRCYSFASYFTNIRNNFLLIIFL